MERDPFVSIPLLTDDKVLKAIGHKFRLCRERKNLSREDLSSQSGVPVDQILALEEGGDVPFSSIIKFCRAFQAYEAVEMLFASTPYKSMEDYLKNAPEDPPTRVSTMDACLVQNLIQTDPAIKYLAQEMGLVFCEKMPGKKE